MSTLDDIKARLAGAVNLGEWSAKHPPGGESWIAVEKPMGFTNVTAVVATKIDPDDADFIAQAPKDMARMIAALEAAESMAAYLDGLADGDKHYAKLFRDAINAELAKP